MEIAGANGNTEILISDITGRKIAFAAEKRADSKYLISIGSDLPSGIYLLLVRNERNAVVKSLVIH